MSYIGQVPDSQTLTTPKQDVLLSGINIKTVNGGSILGSGDMSVQSTLVSGTNIKTVNGTSLVGAGNISVAALPAVIVSANTTAVAGNHYFMTGAYTLTMPSTPAVNDRIQITNVSLLTSGVIIDFGSIPVRQQTAGQVTMDSANTKIDVQYSGNATYGWL
jgi:hypothetical protein